MNKIDWTDTDTLAKVVTAAFIACSFSEDLEQDYTLNDFSQSAIHTH